MGLIDIYNESTNPVVKDARDKQASPIGGKESAFGGQAPNNFMPDEYQTGFTLRDKGDKVITQGVNPGDTKGHFKDSAINFYDTIESKGIPGSDPSKPDKSMYNAADKKTYYSSINTGTKGVNFTYKP